MYLMVHLTFDDFLPQPLTRATAKLTHQGLGIFRVQEPPKAMVRPCGWALALNSP